jgi:hypothetical protein
MRWTVGAGIDVATEISVIETGRRSAETVSRIARVLSMGAEFDRDTIIPDQFRVSYNPKRKTAYRFFG